MIIICDVCLKTPCDCRCPNAPDPHQVFICSGCGEPILEGENYWDIMGEQWCQECIDKARGTAEYDPY